MTKAEKKLLLDAIDELNGNLNDPTLNLSADEVKDIEGRIDALEWFAIAANVISSF